MHIFLIHKCEMRTTADFHSHWMNSLGFILHFKCAHENPSENIQWKFNVVRNTTQHKQKEFLAITRTRKHRIDFNEKYFQIHSAAAPMGRAATLPCLVWLHTKAKRVEEHSMNSTKNPATFSNYSRFCRVASHVTAATDPFTIQLQQDPLLSGRILSLLNLWTFASLIFEG